MLGEMVQVYTAADARRVQFEMSLAAGTDIAKALPTADDVLADPASEVLATGLDQDARPEVAGTGYLHAGLADATSRR